MFRRTLAALAIALATIAPARAAQNTVTTPGPPLTMAQLATFLNNAFVSVGTNYSGATPPAVFSGSAQVGQFWLDVSTSPWVLRINDGVVWNQIGALDPTLHSFTTPIAQTPNNQSGTTYTAIDANRGQLVRFTNAGAVAVTQPQPGLTFTAGWWVDYRNVNATAVTVTSTLSTIDGAATLTLSPGRSVRLISDGTNYVTGQTVGTPTTAVLGGLFSKAAIGSQWLRSLGTDGLLTSSQPAFTDLSGSIACTQLPALTGDITTVAGACPTTLATVNANVGSFGSSTAIPTITVNGKGLITAISTNAVIAPAGTLTGATLAANVLASSLTSVGILTGGATGSGFTVALTTSTITGTLPCANHPALTGDVTTSACAATIAANAVTNAKAAQMAAFTIKGNTTGSTANATDFTIQGLTQKVSPAAGDFVMIADSAASNALKYALVSSLASAGSVSSIAGNTGAFTLGVGLTNAINDLRVSLSTASNILGSDVALNNTSTYFDGPSMAQGTSGTWFVSGHVTVSEPAGSSSIVLCKLWDGTTVISSGSGVAPLNAAAQVISLSGFLASPAANIKITCKDTQTTTASMKFNISGNSKDSAIFGVRIAP